MREHEVPTHVQAEDKVLLWFTFPQIVAVVAVCAVAYGAYRYFPFGPSEFRLGLAILLGILGIAAVVGKVGGRGLPLVAADLLKFNLGARRYAGAPAQLARSEATLPVEARPDPLRLLAKKAAGGVGKAVKAARRRDRRPFRPHGWFGKRRLGGKGRVKGNPPAVNEARDRKPWYRLLAVAGLLADCWPCPPPPWPTTRMKSPTATPGGWTKSTSCRRSRSPDAASSWSVSRSPATPPP